MADGLDDALRPENADAGAGPAVQSASSPHPRRAKDSFTSTLRQVTRDYIDKLDLDDLPSPEDMERELCEKMVASVALHNASTANKEDKWQAPKSLAPAQIADLMFATNVICRVRTADDSAGEGCDMLAMYVADPRDRAFGTHSTDEERIRKLARRYCYTLTSVQSEEVIACLRDLSEVRERTADRDLVAVDNGVFDYRSKTLLRYDDPAFDPTSCVFTVKSHVPYDPSSSNPIIHNASDGTDWDVESWISELSDDPEVVELIWCILSAVVRPNVDWDKSAWLYSRSGSNGKGTLCTLMRNLCGQGAYASIPIAAFSRDFMLEPLMHASAVIVDENDVGTFIDSAANLKAVITNDVVLVNRKHKAPISFQFRGFMVQCLNEMPRIRDRSDSFYRRQLFVPFDKTFTGAERRYIKHDYMHRPEVLRYVLKRVLESDFYELPCPAACAYMLDEYKLYNDPVREFFEECIVSRARWDMVPLQFAYDLYKAWLAQTNPAARPLGRATFYDELSAIVATSTTWLYPGSSKVRVAHRMDGPEPMILEFGLSSWMGGSSHSSPDVRATPAALSAAYRCILRAVPQGAAADDEADDDESED